MRLGSQEGSIEKGDWEVKPAWSLESLESLQSLQKYVTHNVIGSLLLRETHILPSKTKGRSGGADVVGMIVGREEINNYNSSTASLLPAINLVIHSIDEAR